MGHEPRVAFLSYSNFGSPVGHRLEHIREAVRILDTRNVNFEYEGEMAADVALNPAMSRHYPFSRFDGPRQRSHHARPAVGPHFREVAEGKFGDGKVIGPFLVGMQSRFKFLPP